MTQAATMTTRCTPKTRKSAKKAIYTGVLVRVYDKATGVALGYVAKPLQPCNADGSVKVWYQITCDEHGHWHCTCEGNATFGRQCMHIDAAKILCEIRVKAGRPGCYASALPSVVALPETKELAALTALAASIPGPSSERRATASLQPRPFALPPSYQELTEQRRSA